MPTLVYLIVPGSSKPLGIGPPVGMIKRPLEFWEPFFRKMDTWTKIHNALIIILILLFLKSHSLFYEYLEILIAKCFLVR